MNQRMGGLAAITGGLIWIGFFVWFAASGKSILDALGAVWVLIPAVLCLAAALFSLARTASSPAGRAGLFTAIAGLMLIGAGLLGASLGLGTAWYAGMLGEMVSSIGLFVFALANFEDKVLPRFNPLPLILVLLYMPSFMIDPANLSAPFPPNFTEGLAALAGVCWVLIGLLMLVAKRGRSVPQAV